MLDEDNGAALGIGFDIDTGDSFAELTRLQEVVTSTEAKVLADFNRIEKASSGMVSLAKPTSAIKAFGNEATGTMQATAAQIRSAEKAAEGLILKLTRETAALGKTRDEMRDLNVEAKALAAVKFGGNTDVADRLLAAARARKAVEDSLSEDRAAAELAATAAAARERAAAEAAINAQLLERSRLQGALDRTNGADRPRALDAGASFSALSAKAAEDEARATALVASAARQAADEHARLAAMVRGSNAAMEADAASAERLRASTDPLYAATSRLNAEIAESTRLYHAGVTSQREYARQQEILTGRLRATALAQDEIEKANKRNGHTMQQLGFQLNDIITMAMSGANPMQIFATQAGQIFQVAQMAEGGVKGFAKQIGLLALSFTPLIAVAGVAGVALYRWHDQLGKDANLKKYAEGLGLTKKEMKELKDVGVTTGDVLAGMWKTLKDRLELNGKGKKLVDYLFSPTDAQQVATFVSQIYGSFAGGYKGIVEVWGLLPAAIGDVVSRSAKATVVAIEGMINGAIDRVNALAKGANALIGVDLFGQMAKVKIETPAIDAAVAQYAGAGKKAGAAFGKNVAAETKNAMSWMKGVVADVGKNTIAASHTRLDKQRDKIVEDRTDKKDKPDRHAAALARDAAAIEAQIKNLYALADAYGVSGAAALIAEARVKAESRAIKQRADIEAAVSREVQLAIAQRVSDSAKATASVRNEAAAQERVNAMVAAGLISSERAADLVRDQLADLPLLEAAQAAQQRGLVEEANRATKALTDQQKARADLAKAAETRQFNADAASGRNQLEQLREELRLVGATDAARVHALATVKATQEAEAKFTDPARRAAYIKQQVEIADAQQDLKQVNDAYNASLIATSELFDTIDQSAQRAARGMSDAFGNLGSAIGDALTIMTGFYADQARLQEAHQAALREAGTDQKRIDRENSLFAMRTSSMQIGAFGDMAAAAKGFFKEGSSGYQAMATAEKAFRTVQFVLSVRAIAQDAIETGSKIANSVARTAAGATEAVVSAIKSLPFPLNLAAGAATIAALASIGVSIAGAFGGGSKDKQAPANTGTGTVLGNSAAQSESLKRSIDALKEVDTLTNTYARQMAASLKSIDSQIGNVAALVVRAGDVNASAGVKEGFKSDTTGKLLSGIVTGGGLFSKIPVVGSIIGAVGGLIGSLFGSKTTVVGSGLYGKDQQLGSVLAGGYDASYYSDIEKQKKFLGIKTGKSYSTQYSAADAGLENQFTMILKQFNDAIAASAGPLGVATSDVQARLNGFVVSIGKIDLKGLTGEQIQEKLTAVFGAAADKMAATAIPGLERFQKVGEGAFETLVRVASTVEAVGTSLDLLGTATRGFSIDAKIALADQFDSISDLTNAASAYFETFYSKEEQAAAKTAQLAKVFGSLGMAMPANLAGFRQLVEAQDLNTAAGQAAYATLLKLAPAFADLQSAMEGAKSAADVAAERQDLERQMLELQGNTAAIRALDLAKLDASNRELQQQIWAIQDAQEAAKAAEALRDAWTSVGDSILDEVNRIRGITDAAGGNGFAALQGQFNAATTAARAGDQDAAKSLPALSQALLAAAADQATSRQELARVQAMTAASLAATYGVVTSLASGKTSSAKGSVPIDDVFAAVAQSAPAPANDGDMASEIKSLREEVAGMRRENNSSLAAITGNTKGIDRKLGDLSADHGGMAISVASAA